jgi:cytoskeleton-associated protein 5
MAIYFLSSIQPKPIMENVKKAISATNPAVRSAAMNLIGTLYLYLGPQLLVFFEDEKSQVQQQIQAEFDKVKFTEVFIICNLYFY